jgi:predicted dithiol-disulfide oxidoreductase (DUF899 family)
MTTQREDTMTELTMQTPPVVTAAEWEAARQRLLVREKEVTRARDALAAERRRMPWLRVEQEYAFDGPDGRVSLLGLFQGRRQLIPACTAGLATRASAAPWSPTRWRTSPT